jgi:TonB family protein
MKQKKGIENIVLSFQCPQNWDSMTICGNGRYCGICHKTVVDFTDKSQSEYDAIVQKHDGQLCGRFTKKQMSSSRLFRDVPSVNFAKAAAFTAFTLVANGCFMGKTGTVLGEMELFSPIDTSVIKQTALEKPKEEEAILGMFIEPQPEFIGGIKAMYEFLRENLRCPQEVCGEGTVYVGFTVEIDGSLTNIQIKRGISIFNEEALRVVKLMSKGMWKGGQQGGKPARVNYTIPIKFRLE